MQQSVEHKSEKSPEQVNLSLDWLWWKLVTALPEKGSTQAIPLSHSTEYRADPTPFIEVVTDLVAGHLEDNDLIEIERYTGEWKPVSKAECLQMLGEHIASKIRNSIIFGCAEIRLGQFQLLITDYPRKHQTLIVLEVVQETGWGPGGRANVRLADGRSKLETNTEPGKKRSVSRFKIKTYPSL